MWNLDSQTVRGLLVSLMMGASLPAQVQPPATPERAYEVRQMKDLPAAGGTFSRRRVQPPSSNHPEIIFTNRSRIELPLLDLKPILKEDALQGMMRVRKQRIGVHRSIHAADESSAQNVQLQDGSRIYLLQIVAPDALGISVHFEGFDLDQHFRMVVYEPGSDTEFYEFSGKGPQSNGEFWTPILPGGTVNIEVSVPAEEQGTPSFAIREIGHVYLDPVSSAKLDFQPGIPGACNLDASCYPAYDSFSKSVGLIAFQNIHGIYACSGTLLNNATQDSSPFFLTAHHCFEDGADTMNFYWAYRNDSCGGPAPSLSTVPHTVYGFVLAGKDRASGSDFSLVQILGPIPPNATFAGWNIDTVPSGSAVAGVHHPKASYQRISFGNLTADLADFHGATFGQGTMEPGSSGSALINDQKQVLGQLWGGSSSCANPSGQDEYGKLSTSYLEMKNQAGGNYLQLGLGDDEYEPNDTRNQAKLLLISGSAMVIRVNNDDWFKLPMGPYDSVYVTVMGNQDFGELGVEAFQGNETTALPIVPAFVVNRVDFSRRNNATAQDFLLHFSLKTGQRSTYALYLTLTKAQPPNMGVSVKQPVPRTSATLQYAVNTGPTLLDATGWIEWGASSDPETFVTTTPVVVSGEPYFQSFTTVLSGLSPGTEYFYRTVVTNDFKTVTSPIQSFRTAATTMTLSSNPVQVGNIALNTPVIASVVITNTGEMPLVLAPSFWNTNYLDASECSAPIPAGSSCSIRVTISGSESGSSSVQLQIVTNSESGTVTVYFDFTTIGPRMGSEGGVNIFFGQLVYTSSEWREWKIKNLGNADMSVYGVEPLPEFEATHNCPTLVPPNGMCSIFVRFAPKHVIPNTSTAPIKVFYNNNAPLYPFLIFVQAQSWDMVLALSRPQRPSRTGAVSAQIQTFDLALTPTAGMSGEAQLTCTGALPGMTCSVTPAIVQLSGAPVNATIQVTTTPRSQRLRATSTKTVMLKVNATFQGITRSIDLPVSIAQ